MDQSYIVAISAVCGSLIGASASLATTWFTQRHQEESRRHTQEHARRERIFVGFIDQASRAYLEALVRTHIEDPSTLIPLYATMGKLRLFASERTVKAADDVMNRIVETYYAPKFDLQTRPTLDQRHDILREFAQCCRVELHGLISGNKNGFGREVFNALATSGNTPTEVDKDQRTVRPGADFPARDCV